MNFPKAFEDYWSRAHRDIGRLELWQQPRLKKIAYNAWRAGRKTRPLGDQK